MGKLTIPIREIFDSISFHQNNLIQILEETIKRKLSPFDILLNENSIDTIYYNIVTKNLRALLWEELITNLIRKSEVYNVYNYHQIDSLKNGIYLLCDPLDTTLYKGLLTEYYLYDYYLIKTLDSQKKLISDQLKDSIISTKNKKIYISSSFVPFLLIKDKRLQENLWGRQLYNFINLLKERVKTSDIESFEYLFPQSIWIRFMNNLLRNNNSKPYSFNNDSNEILYIDSSNKIETWDSLMYQFRGKPIFIDIWATWCLPCRQEFQFNDKLDSFLIKENISKLFISVDKPFLLKTWKDIIQTYPLKGYHILANQALIKVLKEKIYEPNEDFPIPRYVIVNKDGEIIERNANRPSSENELFDQLKRILQIN